MPDPDLSHLSRRDLLRLSGQFGWSSVLLAAGGLSGLITLPRLAAAAEAKHAERSRKPARHKLLYGVSFSSEAKHRWDVEVAGTPQFIQDLEARSDGEIRVELVTGGRLCKQLDCVKRARQGLVDIFRSATQNAGKAAPYYHALDFPFLFPSRAAQNYFLYHPQSETLFREPLRKHYGLQFLFTNCRLRGLMMALPWKEKAPLSRIEQLKGLKIRSTPSPLGRIALGLLGAETRPMPWEETANALRFGLVDGAETWESAIAANIPEVVGQVVDLRLFSGNSHTAMSLKVFEKFSSELQDAIMESAYFAQVFAHIGTEAAMVNTVGASNPQKAETILAQHRIPFVELAPEERRKAEQLCAPEFNPEPWESWREKLNKLAGDVDVYQTFHKIARKISVDTLAENVAPRRWWKG